MRAAGRLFAILEAVAVRDEPASPTAIAIQVGLSLSTTSRLMRELEADGLLERESVGGSYLVGPRFLNLARASIRSQILLAAATPAMHELRDLTGETVSLSVRRGHARLCVSSIESLRQLRRVVPIGIATPLHGGATSEVLLAALSQDELYAYFAAHAIGDSERRLLEIQLEDIRRTGWALSVDRVENGVAGLATAVYDGKQIVAAISVSGPSSRWTVSLMRTFAPEITRLVRRISEQISRDGVRTPSQSQDVIRAA